MIAVELGSTFVRGARRGEAMTFCQPSLLARDANSLQQVARGDKALELQSGAPGSVQFLRPIRAGRIMDWDGALMLLQDAIAHLHKKRGAAKLALAVPADLTLVQRRAWAQLAKEAGASEVQLVESPLAAALGCGCDLGRPAGRLVLDWGGGCLDLGLVSGRQLLAGESGDWGGLDIDAAVQRAVRQQEGLLLSLSHAEEIKQHLLSALPSPRDKQRMEVTGFGAVDGLPKTVELQPGNLQGALEPYLLRLREALLRIFGVASAEICADLLQEGMLLCGGASRLRDLREFLEQVSGLRVISVEAPEEATIRGLAEWIRFFN
jgi:rod shape-determining protein MreB and related proteins